MMMKKVLGLLIALIMAIGPANALAHSFLTLEELKEEAPSNWRETYVDQYGRDIEVDVEIQVFGEHTAPVLKLDFSDLALVRDRWDEDVKVREDGVSTSVAKNNPHRMISSGKLKDNEKKWTAFSSYGKTAEPEMIYGQAYGNDITLREALDYLELLLDRMDISSERFMMNPIGKLRVWTKVDKNTGKNITPAFYVLELWRQYRGLPVLAHASAGFSRCGWPVYQPVMHFSMRSTEEYRVIVYDSDEVDIMEDDIPLCSVERIIEGMEREIKEGHVRKVFEMQFGYAIYNDPDFPKNTRSSYDAECYYAVPSWVVNCIYMDDPEEEEYSFHYEEENDERDAVGYRSLVFNAQTGEILDPQDQSKDGWGNADYEGFISWNDI